MPASFILRSGTRTLDLARPRIMGVLNVTPDSFSDGGRFSSTEQACEAALAMVEAGADVIDIGGESSGPGSQGVSCAEELDRVLPVLKRLRSQTDVWISIDTWRAEVARQALDAGADVLNDVTALRGDPEMLAVAAQHQVPVVLMYSKDTSARTEVASPSYDDVVQTVVGFLEERLQVAEAAGLVRSQLLVDPGLGFFVSGHPADSFALVRRLEELGALGSPVLVGPSRKSFLAKVSAHRELGVRERLIPSLGTAAAALERGASLLRMHDVAEAVLLRDTWEAIQGGVR